MKALIVAALAIACAVSLTACSSLNGDSSSMSSSESSIASSMPESSSMPSSSSSSGAMSDLESSASDMISDVESAVSPTMGTDFDKIGALGVTQVKWGPGVQVDKNNRTTEAVKLQAKYGRFDAYFIAPENTGKFYLTFDEGYENGCTAEILDILKIKQVQAVFFITGDYAQREPELVQRMIDEGHVLGNHTWKHWNPTEKTLGEAKADIVKLHDYVKETFDYNMFLYRPPEGAFSEQTLAMLQQMGYVTVLWSFAYKDYDVNNQPDYATGYARTTKFIHEGAIYLLHAVSKTNAKLLPAFIDEVRARDLEFTKWDIYSSK